MDRFAPDSNDRPRDETPANARFTTQAATAEDLLKSQTVGLVNLNDYRKRRAEALDMKERGLSPSSNSGTSTPMEEYDQRVFPLILFANLQSTENRYPNPRSRRSAR
jgi:protein FAM50